MIVSKHEYVIYILIHTVNVFLIEFMCGSIISNKERLSCSTS